MNMGLQPVDAKLTANCDEQIEEVGIATGAV